MNSNHSTIIKDVFYDFAFSTDERREIETLRQSIAQTLSTPLTDDQRFALDEQLLTETKRSLERMNPINIAALIGAGANPFYHDTYSESASANLVKYLQTIETKKAEGLTVEETTKERHLCSVFDLMIRSPHATAEESSIPLLMSHATRGNGVENCVTLLVAAGFYPPNAEESSAKAVQSALALEHATFMTVKTISLSPETHKHSSPSPTA